MSRLVIYSMQLPPEGLPMYLRERSLLLLCLSRLLSFNQHSIFYRERHLCSASGVGQNGLQVQSCSLFPFLVVGHAHLVKLKLMRGSL